MGRHIWWSLFPSRFPPWLPSKQSQLGQRLDQLNFEHVQQWTSHHLFCPCPRAAPLLFYSLHADRISHAAMCPFCPLFLSSLLSPLSSAPDPHTISGGLSLILLQSANKWCLLAPLMCTQELRPPWEHKGFSDDTLVLLWLYVPVQTRTGPHNDGSCPLPCERGNSRSPHGKQVLFAMKGIKQQDCGQHRTLWSTGDGHLGSGQVREWYLEAGFHPGILAAPSSDPLPCQHQTNV